MIPSAVVDVPVGRPVGNPVGGASTPPGQSSFLALFSQALGAGAMLGGTSTQADAALLGVVSEGTAALLKSGLPIDPEVLSDDEADEGALASLMAFGAFSASVDPAALNAGGQDKSAMAARVGGLLMPHNAADFAGYAGSRPGGVMASDAQGEGMAVLLEGGAKLSSLALSQASLLPVSDTPAGEPATAGQLIAGAGIATGGTPSAATATPDKAAFTLATTVGTPGWHQELGDKLVWMAGRQGHTAELTLTPPALGSLEVRLNLSGGEAGAQFYSPHASVREAIETALPRLREMLAAAGLTLGEATVSNQPFQDHKPGQGEAGGKSAGTFADPIDEIVAHGVPIRPNGMGLVDFYA